MPAWPPISMRPGYARRFSTASARSALPRPYPACDGGKFELAISLKTARALGVTIPPSVLLQADQVIE